jgi:putative ABC transport system ATP-binding protein
MENDPPAARAIELRKTYGTGQAAVDALAGVTVTFDRGRFTAVMGPSGSGKSTLMHCMAGLDQPTSGQVFVGGQDISTLNDGGLTRLRRDRIGFVFQSFNLVPTLSAAENITLPLDLAGVKADPDWFDQLVRQLDLTDRLTHRPSQLSGGHSSGSPARGRSSPGRTSSSPTSRPGTSTQTPPPSCSISCGARSRTSASRSSW